MADNITINIVDNPTNVSVGLSTTPDVVNVSAFSGSAIWGNIIGLLSAQTDLWYELSAKALSSQIIPTITDYLSTNPVLVESLNTKFEILSAGVNLFDIFITSAEESQALSYDPATYNLSIALGNTVNLSSILLSPNFNAVFQTLSTQSVTTGTLNAQTEILSGGTDLTTIFSPSNTSWTLSANNGTFGVAGGDTLSVQGGNGVDVKVAAGTDTVRVSGIDATTSVKGVASFSSDNFAVNGGNVTVKDGGIANAELAGSITDDKLSTISTAGKVLNSATTATSNNTNNAIVARGASGEFNSGTITVAGNVSASDIVYGSGSNSQQWGNVFTAYSNTSASFATNTLLQSASALLTPLTLTRTLTGQLVLNTDFNSYKTNVATTTATFLPTTVYQSASGGFALSGYNTTISDTVSSVTVGGASPLAASEWKTKSIVQALDTILFPDLAPTYTIPTISIGSNIANGFDYEIGTSISPLLTITAVRNDAGGYSTLYFQRNNSTISTVTNPTSSTTTNVADQYGYTNPNNPNSLYQPTYTDSSFAVPLGQTTWRAMGDYSSGIAKRNNKNVVDTRAFAVRSVNAPQLSATSFTSSTVTVDGFYRRWVGSLSALPANPNEIRTAGLTTSLDTGAGNLAATPILINQKVMIVLIPSTRTLTSVITQNNEPLFPNFSLSAVTVNDAGGTGRSYNLYYYETAVPLGINLTTVSIS